jgi:hypothetical protein
MNNYNRKYAYYVEVDSNGKLCSLTVRLDLLWAAETNSNIGRGRHLLKHSYDFYLLNILVIWVVLMTFVYTYTEFVGYS